PLPRPPESEFRNKAATDTIRQNPALFKLVSPINVDRFEQLLAEHPNRPFVHSVCAGFRHGFWPFASGRPPDYPDTWDESQAEISDPSQLEFIHAQINEELQLNRFSPAFGPDLLPGMYSSPIHAVPKPGSDKLRLVTDQSAGDYSPNSLIDRRDIAGASLDNIRDLGYALR
ncbi:hypothetical protein CONPUDRAFT_25209, partial [Coniophora puteana RWD-64-598 SS2]